MVVFKNCGIRDKSTMFHSDFMVYERFSLHFINPCHRMLLDWD